MPSSVGSVSAPQKPPEKTVIWFGTRALARTSVVPVASTSASPMNAFASLAWPMKVTAPPAPTLLAPLALPDALIWWLSSASALTSMSPPGGDLRAVADRGLGEVDAVRDRRRDADLHRAAVAARRDVVVGDALVGAGSRRPWCRSRGSRPCSRSGSVTEPDAREIVLLFTERASISTLPAAVTVPSTRATAIEMWSVTVERDGEAERARVLEAERARRRLEGVDVLRDDADVVAGDRRAGAHLGEGERAVAAVGERGAPR